MITFDFFNDSSTELVEKFCEYFQLDKETVEDYFIRVNPDTLTPETLVRKFDLKLNEYDSSQLQIVCRHMTTSTEDTPKDEAAPKETAVDRKTVRAFLADKSRSGKTSEVKNLIEQFGFQKLSDVPDEKLPELYEKAQVL